MNLTRLTLITSAILLCGTSLFYSVGFWVSIPSSIESKWFAGATAVAAELCKFAFFPIAAGLVKTSVSKGATVYCLATLLLLLSIVATVAFLETGSIEKIEKQQEESTTYQFTIETIKSLDQEIETLNGLIRKDMENGFRQRAFTQRPKLNELREEKLQAQRYLENMPGVPSTGVHSLFDNWANKLDKSVISVRQGFYLAVAVLIDVLGIACLLLLASNKITTVPVNAKTETETPNINPTKAKRTTNNKQKYEYIKERIASGEHGDNPALRNVKADEKIGYPAAKRIFDALVSENKLRFDGNQYELVRG